MIPRGKRFLDEKELAQNIENADEIVAELKKCADIISGVDLQMQDIRKKIH